MRLHHAGFVLLLSLATACGDRTSGDAAAPTGGTMVVAAPGSGSSPMFPPLAIDAIARLAADNLFERLAEIGPELNTVGDQNFTPRLAERWEWAADSMSIAFHLDQRARWHDGRPVRANDVKFTLDLLKDPATGSQYASVLGTVDSVSVRDSLTAVAWYNQRTPSQFYNFVYQMFVLPEHVYGGIPRTQLATSAAVREPVGSGQFRFARFEPGSRFEMVADTAHHRGRPKLDRVIVSYSADVNAAIGQVLSGQADLFEVVPAPLLPRIDSSQTVRAVPYPSFQYAYFGMNSRDPQRLSAPHPILSDTRVRRAISMALDRQAMLRNVFDTLGRMGAGPYPGPLADTAVRLPPFDRARAAALLDSAGWTAGADGIRTKNGRPLSLNIIVPTSSAPRMAYAVLIQEQLKGIGVRASLESMDFNAFIDRQLAGRFDAAMIAMGADPSRSTAQQLWTTPAIHPNGANWTRYSNPTFDATLDSALTNPSVSAGNAQYRRAMQTLVNDAPAVWLYDVPTVMALHRRIQPGNLRADAWWADLPNWWVAADQRIDRDRIGLRSASAQP